MDIHGLLSFIFLKVKEFIIFYLCILLGEWFAEKHGWNLFERAWLITIIALSIITFVFWAYFGRSLRWF
ncbi:MULTISPECIES: hypothetical protein [Bacillaceae]|uniref:hypothetical protein n=1 Tax=Bacillaceae TaxID=186817 RepID=UPI0028565751|nr:hypothetical protein [Bacillus sp. SLBN-46]MDR6121432.1 hypothetical protein [Bacillus sp. SLBN-46]